MPSEHLALVSLDIKSAFDTMNWPVLFKTLESYDFPAFFKNFICFYLKNRRVFYTNDVLEIFRPCSKGCPQGSVIAPTIWNIYINFILKNDIPDLQIQAFADDLALLIGGQTARELESKTNLILAVISNNLEDLQLKLSIEKCQAVVYRSIASQKFPKRNSIVLNRKPTFKIKNHSIKANNMVGLSWVKVHVGIPGNELADQQAKLAITSGEELFIPAPYSHLKCLLKNYIVKNGMDIGIAMIQPRELG
ncbi:hypothetical protein AVEN_84517-1 [Araneus ventricosus]|uniref:Reverse transcriptase domain-containing protein n=1 Tax=Araneus ventricosus TaxID=182803 RepID=A0A4Y2FBI9_ARAVE|nr:hypothetical protein AVEN_84517-1 [Araneus ventricosus]